MGSISFSMVTLLFSAALQLNFHNVSFDDFIEHRFSPYASFSDKQHEEMCHFGDNMSCILIFLRKAGDEKADINQLSEFISDNFKGPDASVARYVLIGKQFDRISMEKMKILLSAMPEQWSKKLFPLMLKKMHSDGMYEKFIENYAEYNDIDLIYRYVSVMINRDTKKAFEYLMSVPENHKENFFKKLDKLVTENRSIFLKKGLAKEYELWKLRYNFQRIRYRQTIKLADRWFPRGKISESLSAWTAHLYKARSLTRRREHEKAVVVYEALNNSFSELKPCKTTMYRFFKGMGFSFAALGKNSLSMKAYFSGYEFFSSDKNKAADFLYSTAEIARLDGNYSKSEKYYKKIMKNYKNSRKFTISQFLYFWVLYLQSRYEEAENALSNIIEQHSPGEYSYRRAMYWYARVASKLGENEKSIEKYTVLSNTYPATYYGSLAAGRLAHKGIKPENNEKKNNSETIFTSSEFMPETLWMLALHINEDKRFLRELIFTLKSSLIKNGNETDLLSASYLSRNIDLYHLAVSFMKSVSSLSAKGRRYIRLSYPVLFEKEILPHADFYNVSPLFVLSIARQESLFDFKAVSTAYAIGFLQIIPSTARLLARREKYGRMTPQKLKKPLTNIRFGISYLNILLNSFDGSLPLAAGAYNAGPGRIRRWLKTKRDFETDEFIEDIPIFQTRDYIKKVMRNYAVYHYIYHGEPFSGITFDLNHLR
ncbi:MAG: transglycosylase SLT domain-containing protein [bacterium]